MLRLRVATARFASTMRPLPTAEELNSLGYVCTTQSESYSNKRSVVVDLHETLVRVEAIKSTYKKERGAPDGCLSDDWETSSNEGLILKGPEGGTDFILHVRPYWDELSKTIKEQYEGILWTVGGIKYVASVIQTLDPKQEIFQQLVMSNNFKYCKDGHQIGQSDWPFLNDCKPLQLLNRDISRCIHVDDRVEYARCNSNNVIYIPPYLSPDAADGCLNNLSAVLNYINQTYDIDVPVSDFLQSLPSDLISVREMEGMKVASLIG